MRYSLAATLAVSAGLGASPAYARDTQYRIDIPAVAAADALAILSAQSGISVAFDQPMPRRVVNAVHGKMTAREALDRVLRSLDLQALRVGPNVYRVVPRTNPTRSIARPVPFAPLVEDIVVTGQKQSEKLSGVAAPIAVYQPESSNNANGATTREVARAVDGFTLSNYGQAFDRPFIRGIADSPFNGFSQSTVSVQVNDARVTYDAPEPALRLVDVARVEILKGPQGPLYGTGALGGVYRIVTNRPELGEAEGAGTLGLTSVAGGGSGGQAEGMINLPLIGDRVAVRVVGYAATDPGWIDDVKGGRDLNRTQTRGARIALRAEPLSDWAIDLGATTQSIDARDSQYVDRIGKGYLRDLTIREPHSSRINIFQSTVAGSIGSLRLTVATSLTLQTQISVDDASVSSAMLNIAAPAMYVGTRRYRVFDQEVRIGSRPGSAFVWVAGAAFLESKTSFGGGVFSSSDGASVPLFEGQRRVTETAIFADGSFPLVSRLRVGLGLRGFRSGVRDDYFDFLHLATRAETLFGITPSTSLSYQLAPGQLIYARFGTALRPGGLDASDVATRRYKADQVRSIDLGARIRLDGGRLSLDGSVFRASWENVQSDYLETNGLIATHSAGRAAVTGAELSVDWRLPAGWRLQTGAIWQHPRLTHAVDGSALPRELRLPVVSDVSARLALTREMQMLGWHVTPGLSVNIVGASRLSFDAGLDRRTPGYVLGRVGVSADRDRLAFRFDIDNVLDTGADTFAFGNPFSVWTVHQYTPARPRTFAFSVSRRF